MNNILQPQKGYAAIFVIFILFLVLGVYALSNFKKSSVETGQKILCAAIDYSQKINFRGDEYVRIKDEVPMAIDITNTHIPKQFEESTETSEQVDGRNVYFPQTRCDKQKAVDQNYSGSCGNTAGDLPASVSYYNTPGKFDDPANIKAKDILFLEISGKTPPPGMILTEVFLRKDYLDKNNGLLPGFITKFCSDKNQPIDLKIVSTDESIQNPPLRILKKDISSSLPRELDRMSDSYTLFAYERMDNPYFSGGGQRESPVGTYTYNEKTYDVSFKTYALYVELVDREDKILGYIYSKDILNNSTSIPPQPGKNALQIGTFDFLNKISPWGWWNPECKPAIYLYPQTKTNVRVKVDPAGYLTYTDPAYPKNGWEVVAYPSGKLNTKGKEYDYLYYESKIKDSAIIKPTKGFVVSFIDLPNFYTTILAKLAFTKKESFDFKDYWEKALPYSPYYFVGLMEEKSIEKIEPLTIEPKPATIIRVRFYFEALDKRVLVEEPEIKTKDRQGFTVFEWGGLVKVDKNHPFTCSQ